MRAAAIGVACATLVFAAACGSEPQAPTTAESTAAQPATPPRAPGLDGAYRLTFDPVSRLNGVPEPPSAATTPDGEWTFRSTCADAGCVATAVSNGDAAQPVRVFDDLAGAWTFVALQPDGWRCADDQGAGSPMWTIWRITTVPDGGLAGTLTHIGTDACPGIRERTVGMAASDAPAAQAPDPGMEQARIPSPAQGLRGRYTWSNKRPDDATLPPASVGYGVSTYCLRTGDRCVTSFAGEPSPPDGRFPVVALNFADGAWTQLTGGATMTCSAGGQSTGTRSYALALPPAPVPDPIDRLTGEVRAEFTAGDCPKPFVFDATLTRTGD